MINLQSRIKRPPSLVAMEGDFTDIPLHQLLAYENAKRLHGIVKYVMDGSRTLVDFVDYNRITARDLGIETIAVELSSLGDSGRLEGIKDALEESLRTQKQPQLTVDGLTVLRRAEKLLADAARELAHYTNYAPVGSQNLISPSMGQASGSNAGLQSLIIGGAILGGFIILAVVLSSQPGFRGSSKK